MDRSSREVGELSRVGKRMQNRSTDSGRGWQRGSNLREHRSYHAVVVGGERPTQVNGAEIEIMLN